MATKVFAEILAELKSLNQSIKHFSPSAELKNETPGESNLSRQISGSRQEYKKILEEIYRYLQDYQGIVDFVIEDQTKRHEELMRELKREFTRLAVLNNPELAGLTRLNDRPVSSIENPVYSYSRSFLQYIAEGTKLGTTAPQRTYYRVGYRTGLASGVTGGVDEGFTQDIGGAGSTLTIVSTSVNDSTVGTGIQRVNIAGVNSSNIRDTETVDLNGTTPVSTVKAFKYVDFFNAIAVGTYGGRAAGTITLSVGGTSYAQIAVGQTQWRGAKFFAGKNELAFIHQWTVSSFKVAVSFQLECSPQTDINVMIPRSYLTADNSGSNVYFPVPIIVQQNGRVSVSCEPNGPGSECFTQFTLHVQPLP